MNDPENENGIFEAAGDSQVVIKVRENPTTGFMWSVDSSDCGARLTQVDNDFVAPTNGLIGAGGQRVWTFQTPDPSSNYIRGLPCDLDFFVGRSWENNVGASPAHSIRLNIN